MTFTSKRALPVQVAQLNHKHGRPGNSVSSRKKEAARNRKLGISKPAAFNIKANTQNNYMSKWKYIKKLQDREHRKHHSIINRRTGTNTPDSIEPPILVAVVGPPRVGKSLLIRSLIKHYTTAKISDCRGPMTILASKHRRITFFECPNDLNAMIDIAKTCDLALLLVDASYGFEMETFEFLTAAQVHGFPRVMGVLTHLDHYKKLKKKQSIVYHVKHRFWKEIYAGAKLFILKGLDTKSNTEAYFKSDIVNLVRFISVLKFRPLVWRNSHPYLLCDRFEDLTEPVLKQENSKIDRTVAFYGYVRGCNFRPTMNIHLFGVGDFDIKTIQEMEDPMPTPKHRKNNKDLRLLVKSGNVYAPMANIGPVIFDKNAAYITVRNTEHALMDDRRIHSWETEETYLKRLKKEATKYDELKLVDIKTGIGQQMIQRLNKVDVDHVIDVKMKSSKLQLFNNSEALTENDVERFEYQQKLKKIKSQTKQKNKNRKRRKVTFDDDIEINDQEIPIEGSDSDLDPENEPVSNENVDKWLASSDSDDGNVAENNSNSSQQNNLVKKNIFDSNWLQSPAEQTRKKQQLAKVKAKEHSKRLDHHSSNTAQESNVRWKQNLLTNASQIWKTQTSLFEYIYGNSNDNDNKLKPRQKGNEDTDSDSDGDFFRVRKTSKMKLNEIDNIDSAVLAYRHIDVNEDSKELPGDEAEQIEQRLRNRFVTGDWVAAQTFEKEVRYRAMNVNPDLFDEDIQKDRQILESLGAETMDESRNNFDEQQLDWEYRLEKIMQDKGVDGEISMSDKIKFAQQGIFSKKDIDADKAQENMDERLMNELFTGEIDQSKRDNISTLELEDLNRLEAKIKKKQKFDREYDAGLLDEVDKVYDLTGISEEQQRKIFKNPYSKNVKRDRQGKIRGQGELNMDDRKNLPGSGKGEYYMDIVRAEIQRQHEINKEEFADEDEKLQKELRGFVPGSYVRITLEHVPHEFETNFDLEYPVILGGLLSQEMQFGFTQCRIKKHRWQKRLLKFNDPIILSIGWRRFQTCPLYCMEDGNQKRLRMIKYTPQHLHCMAVFYAPITPPNTGFIGFQSCSSEVQGFRVAATGNILSSNLSYKIVKKLKLIGEPYEIHRNTAFIKGMFNSQLEVSKFVGAKIRTVSGVRGSIKKAEGPQGNFRATFEDKLLKSDLIFLKSWVPIYPLQFYYAARNLLLLDKESFVGMKTVGQLRAEQNSRPAFKPDSVYDKSINGGRAPIRKFNKLFVPKKLESNLPYRIRPKYQRDSNSLFKTRRERHLSKQNYAEKDEKVISKMIANLSEIAANHNERQAEQKRKTRKRKRVLRKEQKVEERLKKRARIKKKMTAKSNYDGGKFEAVRGNKFHKEWRLQKK